MKLKDKLNYFNTIEIYEMVLDGRLSRFPEFFWEGEDGIDRGMECVRYLVYEKLKWEDEDIKNNFCKKILASNKLGGMLGKCFNNSPLRCVIKLMGDKYKPWEYAVAPRNYWTYENSKNAVIYMIEEILKWDDNDIKNNLCQNTFEEFGLKSMLLATYEGSPYKAINDIYPGRFFAWELKNTPLNFWTDEMCISATKWLVEDVLKLDFSKDKHVGLQKEFFKYGLGYMLSNKFESSPYKAIDFAYPGVFTESNFKTLKGRVRSVYVKK